MGELDDLKDPVEEPEVPEPEGETGDIPAVKEESDQEVVDPEKPAEPEVPEHIPYSRFKEVNDAKKKAKQEADYWREQALKSQPKKEPEAFEKPEPKYDDFDDIGEFTKATTEWALEKRDYENYQKHQQQKVSDMQKGFDSKLSQGDEKYPDFRDVAFLPKIPGHEETFNTMLQVLSDSDHAADIVYYFGKNQTEAARIAMLPPGLAGREIGRLEFKMTETPKKITQPPKPTSPVNGNEPPPTKKEENMTMEEWEVHWEKGALPGSPVRR